VADDSSVLYTAQYYQNFSPGASLRKKTIPNVESRQGAGAGSPTAGPVLDSRNNCCRITPRVVHRGRRADDGEGSPHLSTVSTC